MCARGAYCGVFPFTTLPQDVPVALYPQLNFRFPKFRISIFNFSIFDCDFRHDRVPAGTIVEKATTMFSQQLKVDRTGKRGPYKLDHALDEASSASEVHTAAIFLSRSPKVWLAYHLAQSTHAILYENQQEHTKTLNALEELSVEDRRKVANNLQGTEACSTLQPVIDQI